MGFSGVLRSGEGPRCDEWVATPQRGREGEMGQFRVPLRRDEATVHNIEIYVFCLFCFRCSEDSYIGLMRIL